MDKQKPLEKEDKLTFFDIFESLVRALIVVIILITFIFKVCTVVGSSMERTFYDGEKILLLSLGYTPKNGDVVVFHDTNNLNEPVIKRVIATEGQYVKIDYDNKRLYVSDDEIFDDSDLIDESSYITFISPYTDDDCGGYIRHTGTHEEKIEEGKVFVMGDNRNNSLDSRYSQLGQVDVRSILGKVIFRFSPADKIGIIK